MPQGEIIVIKIGSNLLADEHGFVDLNNMRQLVDQIAMIHSTGKNPIIVSSGAIACGKEKLGIDSELKSIEEKQAAASIGQSILMREYARFFERQGIVVSQVLLTSDAIQDLKKKRNINNTLRALMRMKVVPIVNENDTVVTDEIKLGDNDFLSAHVAELIKADRYIIASDIQGLYEKNPHKYPDAAKIDEVSIKQKAISSMADNTTSRHGTGGMYTKLKAVIDYVKKSGNDAYIISGRDKKSLTDLVIKGKNSGTRFYK